MELAATKTGDILIPIIKEANIPEGPGDLITRGRHQVLRQVGPVEVVGGDGSLIIPGR